MRRGYRRARTRDDGWEALGAGLAVQKQPKAGALINLQVVSNYFKGCWEVLTI